ncbi:hypothetical protein C7S18_12305 [Ahniella affigens]|uniref:Uncharacterized protein n=1 Tax=Ahniella affigens TaxID=2021234 RepID=A0A2P1PSW8_9GAMM|nr:hypothetical protein [Ahniella affigens]AVP97934.1 hypothetical protein C7S18_12305 [Ahniella affigens]
MISTKTLDQLVADAGPCPYIDESALAQIGTRWPVESVEAVRAVFLPALMAMQPELRRHCGPADGQLAGAVVCLVIGVGLAVRGLVTQESALRRYAQGEFGLERIKRAGSVLDVLLYEGTLPASIVLCMNGMRSAPENHQRSH